MLKPVTVMCMAVALAACAPAESRLPDNNAFSPRVTELLASMTLDEKLGQLHQAAGGRSRNLNSRLTDDELDRVRRGEVGSYLHVAGAEPLAALQRVAVEESRLGIPLLFAMDVVHGYRTIFPVPIAMASTWDEADWEAAARVSAEEASASGLHWTFAPMIDIARDPRWGRIVEGGGADPYLGARMAEAQIAGYQGGDLSQADTILATAKHFGAYGVPTGGRDYGTADLSERSLYEIYLPPFYAASRAGSGSMMTAFNDIAGVPSTANETLIDGTLRGRWDFDGLIVSDWNAIAELINHGVAETRADAGALALRAGVDMDMTSAVFVNDLRQAIEAEPALLADLDLAVGRVLTAKERLGLFDNPMAYHQTARETAELLSPDHRALARDVAGRSMVLLKNDDNALPLTAGAGRVAVIGALATDAWTQLGSWRAQGRPDDVVTLLDGLQTRAPEGVEILHAAGAHPGNDDLTGIAEAVALAESADRVVLVVGEDYDLSGEARSRSDLFMPASQRALADAIFNTGKPVIVVLVTGRPLAIPNLAERADAILNTWMLGVEAGPALADIVYGDVSPSGRLPVSFPRATGAVPYTYSEFPSGRPADPDLGRDSNRYHDQPITPQFPFGHGLSYSAFSYGELSATSDESGYHLSVDVTNTGEYEADEVVQLYMRDPVSFVARPQLELRGYRRISLSPGERLTVHFHLTAAQSAVFERPGAWRIEAGELQFHVGASSADLRASASVHVDASGTSDVPASAIETRTEVE
ncbi:glycoside hydrolase family 3 N-terminal domain-containing protein [Maricaulis maris]|jgi:beta-glucosidase|uniref:Beta-glucosidase n=1 Tax=Maricaulis maris (strain MCS10) TaxID=394221 RepID=Q0AL28_MARMM|nr:glycoside hydrolase family 3 N-terminal domain-containing protein [Maricaulis maris]ABI67015.1 Beta-glucosidase [Maricaulis maris MCS10]